MATKLGFMEKKRFLIVELNLMYKCFGRTRNKRKKHSFSNKSTGFTDPQM